MGEHGEAGAAPESDRRVGLRLALAGGGTGGHVVPGTHLLRHLKGSGGLDSLLWFGAGRTAERRALDGVEAHLDAEVSFTKVDLPLESPAGGAPRLRDLAIRFAPATRKARAALLADKTEVVCGLGGFTCLPVVLAARSLRLPTALLEINAVKGKATRWLSPLCERVLHAWPSTMPPAERLDPDAGKHRVIGPPLGPAFTAPPLAEQARRAAVEALGFDSDRLLVLVLGGSQGAQALNSLMRERHAEFEERGCAVLHQVGPGRLEEGGQASRHYYAREYVDDVAGTLRAASLVICRGGASTLAEVAAAGTPAVVVPYPHHRDGHQRANAEALGNGVVLVEESRGQTAILNAALDLLGQESELERRGQTLRDAIPKTGASRLFKELSLLSTSRVSHD